jgi:pimeloyl-ACP methyl ester carboxylesterase
LEATRKSIRLEGANGLRLAADAWGSPEDPPVVLLHGGGQTRHAWSGTGETLARHGWHAISVDLRGHGDSDWSPTGDYGHRAFSSDTATLARSFARPPVLVGASLGGISSLLALGEAARSGEVPVASALVLVDIATRMEVDGARRIIEFMQQSPDGFESLEEAADAIASYNPHRPRPKSLSGLSKNLRLREDGRYRWHWDPAFISDRLGPAPSGDESALPPELGMLDDAARSLDIPTLLVRGRMSDLLSEAGAQEFLELVPHAQFADVSDAGHMVAGDRNDKFTKAVVGFLDSQVRGVLGSTS